MRQIGIVSYDGVINTRIVFLQRVHQRSHFFLAKFFLLFYVHRKLYPLFTKQFQIYAGISFHHHFFGPFLPLLMLRFTGKFVFGAEVHYQVTIFTVVSKFDSANTMLFQADAKIGGYLGKNFEGGSWGHQVLVDVCVPCDLVEMVHRLLNANLGS